MQALKTARSSCALPWRSVLGAALHPRKARRGAALLVALFVLLIITGLGLVAVQTSTEEIQASGNYKLQKQAEQLSSSALTVAMGLVSQNGDAYWTFMKQQMYAASAATGTSTVDLPRTYTFQQAEFTDKMLFEPGGDATNLTPTLSVEMHDPLDGFQAAGYSGKFCFKRFRFDSFGSVGTPPAITALNDPHVRYAVYQHRAYGLLGPIECEGN